MIAVLYTAPNSPYIGVPGVDTWGEKRDARKYFGPHPVIAHPPCERWGRYWYGGPGHTRREKGDDAGCFAAALMAVTCWGGVLEHPADSYAWAAYGMNKPPRAGGWVKADEFGGWTCCVDQGHYGHLAKKATWLYTVGTDRPELVWGRSTATGRIDFSFPSPEARRAFKASGAPRPLFLTKRQRKETPVPFRDLLLGIAGSAA